MRPFCHFAFGFWSNARFSLQIYLEGLLYFIKNDNNTHTKKNTQKNNNQTQLLTKGILL